MITEIKFPKHIKLPEGYKIIFSDGHYQWVTKDKESVIFVNKWQCRRNAWYNFLNQDQ